jgi:hypothetical protein
MVLEELYIFFSLRDTREILVAKKKERYRGTTGAKKHRCPNMTVLWG